MSSRVLALWTRLQPLVCTRIWALILGIVAATIVLPTTVVGCASSESSIGGLTNELPTAVDDTPQRKRARVRLQLATSYFEAGNYSVALDEIKRVMVTDPKFSDAYNVAGLIYQSIEQPNLAEQHFRRAIELSPRDGSAKHNLGWLQCQEKQYDQADISFEQALASPGYSARAKTLMTQGICQARSGNTQGAVTILKHSFDIDPNNPVTSYNLALLLFNDRRYDDASKYIGILNKSTMANAQSLWLGIKVESAHNNGLAVRLLGQRLLKNFGDSQEATLYERGAFNE